MAFGILTAGFLKGAADATAGAFSQAAEDRRRKEALEEERRYQTQIREDEQAFRAGESALTRQFQREEALAEAANAEIAAQAQREQRIREIKLQNRLASEDEVLKQLEKDAKVAEINEYLQGPEYDPNAPYAYSTDVGVIKPTTDKNKTTTVMNPMYTKPGPDGKPRIISLPSIDYEGPDSAEVLDQLWGDLQRSEVAKDFPKLIADHRSGQNPDALDNVMAHLTQYGRSKIAKALQAPTTNDKNAGQILYRNPIMYFGIDQLLPNKQDQKYFYDNFFAKIVPEIAGQARQALGIHPEVTIGIRRDDEDRPVLDLPPNVEQLTWATDGSGKVKPIFAELIPKLANQAKVPVENVLRTFYIPGMSDQQRAEAMKSVLQVRDSLTGTYIDRPNGRTTFNADFDNTLSPLLKANYRNNDGASIEYSIKKGIDLTTLLLPPPKLQAAGMISVETSPRPDYQNKYYLDKYGVDRQAAAQKAGFAQDTLRLVADIRKAQAEGGLIGGSGKIVTAITGVEGVVKGLGDILTRMQASEVQMAPGVRQQLERLNAQGSSIINDQQATAQGITNYLIEALAFAIAGSLQGGAKGNNISNQDINNVKTGLNLGQLFSSEAVANGTLSYLEKKMSAIYTVNQKFAEAATEQEFRAVYVYNRAMGHSYDAGEMGTAYDYFMADPQNPAVQARNSAASSGAGTQTTVNVDGQQTQAIARPNLNKILLGQ